MPTNKVIKETRRAWQSQPWGRPAPQVRQQNQFQEDEIPLAVMAGRMKKFSENTVDFLLLIFDMLIFDMLIRSGDIPDQSRKLSLSRKILGDFFGRHKFTGTSIVKIVPN